MMTNQVNIAVIGTSWWAELMFLPILQNYERANLVAICGRNQERAHELAQKYDIPEIYGDYRQMFKEAKLDAVIISTPDDTHYEMAMAAFDSALHVLCEKSVALNAAHALEMLNKAEQQGLKHMVMYTHHWLPYLQRVKQLLDEDMIGKVFHGYFHWFASYALDGKYMWRFDANRANGIAGDLGSHLIHLSQWYLGNIVAVTGRLGFHIKREGIDGNAPNPANDTSQFILEFENGAQILCYISAVAHRLQDDMKISIALHGEKGLLEAQWLAGQAELMSVTGKIQDSDDLLQENQHVDFAGYFDKNPVGSRLFVDCILDDKEIYPGLQEGYEVQKVIDALIQSHETGRRVLLP